VTGDERLSDDLWGTEPVLARHRIAVEPILADLTEPQRLAVTHRGGPLLVVAGAGSGKTRVLTRRIAYLLATGDARPWEILAITFTNKAADEMKRRVHELVGPDATSMWVATFHSACLRMLRVHSGVLGYERGFTIYDAGESESLVERIIKELGWDTKRFPPRGVTAQISAAKNELISPEQFSDEFSGRSDPHRTRVAEVYRHYAERLVTANAMDFDDLLINAVRMLRHDEGLLAQYQERFRHVLVDEFQDTNMVQNELVTLLAREHRQISVVGDSDQSIYRFRAADVRNILLFSERFPDATTVVLEQNFRSTQRILDAANAVIEKNPSRHPKKLFTTGAVGEKIRRYRAGDEYDEARWVASELRRLRHDHHVPFGQMAVFYRVNAASRVLEEEMLRTGVPYKVVSGQRFYERKEIRDALAYARLILNPRDEAAARRVINEPRRGVGDVAQSKLGAYAANNALAFAEAASFARAAGLTGRAVAGAADFVATLERLRAYSALNPPAATIRVIVEETGVGRLLANEATDESRGRLENLGELASAAAQYETLAEFVERMALVSDTDEYDATGGVVSLMTLHVAKGLEFDGVILTGLEEGTFPHAMAMGDPDQLEEERRLCYVGLTRARSYLAMTHAWSRTRWGHVQEGLESRFLKEIPAELYHDLETPPPIRRSSFVGAADGFLGRTSDFTEGRAFGSGPAPKVRSTGAELLGIGPDDRVVHERFGPGVVLEVSGEGFNARARVRFGDDVIRQLVLAVTPLTRAE
jgi:DNA helicase II / ATP-dependent DNA helicase PcrA